MAKEEEKINQLFKEKNLHYDFTIKDNAFIEIIVENGDWKHDHIRLRNIMADAGYVFLGRHIPDTEENSGDDSFSAVYLYHV